MSDGQLTAITAVGELNPKEFADLRASDALLAPMVARTGGGVFWLNDGLPSARRVARGRDSAGRHWFGLIANKDYIVTGIAEVPLLPAPLVLALVLGLAMLAWYRESR